MERIGRERLIVKMMMMVMSIIVLILSVSVSMVVKANDHDPVSSEDGFNLKKIIPKTFINGGHQIINKLEGLFKGSTSTNILQSTKENTNYSILANVTYGFRFVQPTEYSIMFDYVVAYTMDIGKHEVGLFAIYDGFRSVEIPLFLKFSLFHSIIAQPTFFSNTTHAVREGYRKTNTKILENPEFYDLYDGLEASTAVTAILLRNPIGRKSNYKLVVANVGSSRAIICCKNGIAKQLSVDHVPMNELKTIRERGGYVKMRDFPRISRAFGAKKLKENVSCEPDVVVEMTDDETEFLVLVSHPLQYTNIIYEIMSNQELVDSIRHIKNPWEAADHLTQNAITRAQQTYNEGFADLTSVVVRFQ